MILRLALVCLGLLAVDIHADQRSQTCKECAKSFKTLPLVYEKETSANGKCSKEKRADGAKNLNEGVGVNDS